MKSRMNESRKIKKALRKVMLSAKLEDGFIAMPSEVIFKYPKLFLNAVKRVGKRKINFEMQK